MVVTGIAVHVPLQLKAGISPSFNGREQMVVIGMNIRVPLQLEVDISPFSNGLDQMDVTGIVIHVPLQLEVDISPSSNGQDQMIVNGIVIHIYMQLMVGTFPFSNGREQMDALYGRLYNHSVAVIRVYTILKTQTLKTLRQLFLQCYFVCCQITYILAVALIASCSINLRRCDVYTGMYSTGSTYRSRYKHVDISVASDTESNLFLTEVHILFKNNSLLLYLVTCVKEE